MKKKPLDREDDPFLADKLCDESEGIFLWCLEGLRRLQANSFRFTESSQTKANREDARREADNVLLFLRSEGYIRLKADSAIPSAALYGIYCLWCSDNAYKPLAGFTDARGFARSPAKSHGFGKSIPLTYEEGIDRRVSSGFEQNRFLHQTAKRMRRMACWHRFFMI